MQFWFLSLKKVPATVRESADKTEQDNQKGGVDVFGGEDKEAAETLQSGEKKAEEVEDKAEVYKVMKTTHKPSRKLFFNKIGRRSENRPNFFLIQKAGYGTCCCTRQWSQTRKFKGNSCLK